jgi:hypothetical protein
LGHSSDENENVIRNFLEKGADAFQMKPTNSIKLKNIILEYANKI